MNHIISVNDIPKDKLLRIFKTAKKYKFIHKNSRESEREKPSNTTLRPYNIGLLFFEPSTRTLCSFQTAVNRCDGKFITFQDEYSSSKKGETLYDTIKTMETYCDLLVIRHPQKNIFSSIKDYSKIPVINAGDGDGEHPTQAYLDLFTINSHFEGSLHKILFVGDLKHSRTCHSLIKLLKIFFPNLIYYFLEIEGLEFDNSYFKIDEDKIKHVNSYNSCIREVDVVYMTRIQVERFNQEDPNVFEKYRSFTMNPEVMKNMKPISILMHPLPRNNEIHPLCDKDPRSMYFTQVENGVYVRMALLNYCLKKDSL